MAELPLPSDTPRLQVVMGVAGCGKSTVGKLWSQRIGANFLEGDDFHPSDNVNKMSRGQALTDDDRWPWLDMFATAMKEADGYVVGSCSALKQSYRQRIQSAAGEPVLFIYLDGSPSLIGERLAGRRGHFMHPGLLQSQFDTLELPSAEESAVAVDINQSAESIVDGIEHSIRAKYSDS